MLLGVVWGRGALGRWAACLHIHGSAQVSRNPILAHWSLPENGYLLDPGSQLGSGARQPHCNAVPRRFLSQSRT